MYMGKAEKLTFRPAAPDELQVDLDRPRARIPKRLLRLIEEHIGIRSIRYSRSKSGNTHVSIRINLDTSLALIPSECAYHVWEMEKLFLQAALGSDPVRELLSWGRARNGCPYPTLFFEEKKR